MALIDFENNDKYFVKFFLLDASLNLNKWGVTRQSLERNLETFIGKPFVLTPDFAHPSAIDGDDLLIQQEKFRVGDIIMVGIEQRTGTAYGVAEIFDEKAKDILKNGEVNFVSPSIVFNSSDEVDIHGNAVIENFEGAHVAAVAEPAYTVGKAQIKGKCAGDKGTCLNTLNKVEASVSQCGRYRRLKMANREVIVANKECVQKCIDKKVAGGIEIDDQALAICYSECYDSKKANITPDSLDNITKIDIPRKKKKHEAQEPEITTKNKKKITMPKKTHEASREDKEIFYTELSKTYFP